MIRLVALITWTLIGFSVLAIIIYCLKVVMTFSDGIIMKDIPSLIFVYSCYGTILPLVGVTTLATAKGAAIILRN